MFKLDDLQTDTADTETADTSQKLNNLTTFRIQFHDKNFATSGFHDFAPDFLKGSLWSIFVMLDDIWN